MPRKGTDKRVVARSRGCPEGQDLLGMPVQQADRDLELLGNSLVRYLGSGVLSEVAIATLGNQPLQYDDCKRR